MEIIEIIFLIDFDFNNYNSNYNKPFIENANENIINLNNHLNPFQFLSTNKSLDMSNNNQNNYQNNNQINNLCLK